VSHQWGYALVTIFDKNRIKLFFDPLTSYSAKARPTTIAPSA